ncbi:MAG: 50S ribosomal protein L29 [Candidatus Yanofskybacteria bacterium RIFCSPLOWO2_01_FULL_43_22]|uniref:Large ribosomal subunit protein uL29 n=1 Tax=Candidatus Yanofskybacteria bacterium RIFCSPLOWO2_01_FULL_43_22 TaxID=1802695 RepID=A0A1F8GEB4_9BACT|nr:MAG: 50S ribosomal protein L29 [Candidatus Yanofskybacteria bacterium RIFCSPLOWO2_01_FULL_43_22]
MIVCGTVQWQAVLRTISNGMKSKDIKNRDAKELSLVLFDIKAKMAKLSFELEANTLKDTSQIKKAKKDVARILTEIGSRK